MLYNIDAFLQYPWGRDSFDLTVQTTKHKKAFNFARPTTTIKGFAHAMVLVTVSCCPEIIVSGGDRLLNPELSSEEFVERVIDTRLNINLVKARNVDKKGQAVVRSLLNESITTDGDYIGFSEDSDDSEIQHMIGLVFEDLLFEHNSWVGGVTADEAAEEDPRNQKLDVDNQDDGSEDEGDANNDALDSELPRASSSTTGRPDKAGTTNKKGDSPCHRVTPDPGHDDGRSINVNILLRRAADAVEERVVSLIEGYTQSMKEHLETQFADLKRAMEAMQNDMVPMQTDWETNIPDWGTDSAGKKDGETTKKADVQDGENLVSSSVDAVPGDDARNKERNVANDPPHLSDVPISSYLPKDPTDKVGPTTRVEADTEYQMTAGPSRLNPQTSDPVE